jgi:hypothetical protein
VALVARGTEVARGTKGVAISKIHGWVVQKSVIFSLSWRLLNISWRKSTGLICDKKKIV